MADHSAAATLKGVGKNILNELITHNAIDEADRDADWETTFDELTAKFENLSDSISAIMRLAAAPAPAPEPRTNTMRIDVPKLDPANAHGDWPTFKAQIQALITQHN